MPYPAAGTRTAAPPRRSTWAGCALIALVGALSVAALALMLFA